MPTAAAPVATRSAVPKEPGIKPHRPTAPSSSPPVAQQNKVTRRSSKPIINWFQRKLVGTVRSKALSSGTKGRVGAIPLKVTNRVASSPLPSPGLQNGRQQGRPETQTMPSRRTISLNDTDDLNRYSSQYDDRSSAVSSIEEDSTWSPTSALEADEDASLRPIPPSVPPSPSPSRSSSSYLSDPKTFRSIAASTKPTTLLSIDLNGNGMAHIAQAPVTPISQINRHPLHARTSSTGTNHNIGSSASVTFSALPPSSPSSYPPSIQLHEPSASAQMTSVQAPLHTAHHPRNNPRPSSPPLDNASMLTLASSAFAIPGFRGGVGTPGWGSAPPSALGAGDSVSHFGGSTYEDVDGASLDDEDRLDERDFDASVRALRPRSSRRGSWESEASGWSAQVQATPGTPLTRERSVWTANSIKTGALSLEMGEPEVKTEGSEETGTKLSSQTADEETSLNVNDQTPPAVPDIGDPIAVSVEGESAKTPQSSHNIGEVDPVLANPIAHPRSLEPAETSITSTKNSDLTDSPKPNVVLEVTDPAGTSKQV